MSVRHCGASGISAAMLRLALGLQGGMLPWPRVCCRILSQCFSHGAWKSKADVFKLMRHHCSSHEAFHILSLPCELAASVLCFWICPGCCAGVRSVKPRNLKLFSLYGLMVSL